MNEEKSPHSILRCSVRLGVEQEKWALEQSVTSWSAAGLVHTWQLSAHQEEKEIALPNIFR